MFSCFQIKAILTDIFQLVNNKFLSGKEKSPHIRA
ncbi:hypothetical protein [Salmonella phage SD-13_S19]|nr:hypothetical protein [Salmonella phage SD-11_S17]WPK20278.1 hypothetical protein [Salmonella phage SD-12_S18]WPK20359.1 hypothetical protein [Salmonella phage SD-13_S19]WPK20449.1 hypothetical protein [Salmonella phage SD-14_S20]